MCELLHDTPQLTKNGLSKPCCCACRPQGEQPFATGDVAAVRGWPPSDHGTSQPGLWQKQPDPHLQAFFSCLLIVVAVGPATMASHDDTTTFLSPAHSPLPRSCERLAQLQGIGRRACAQRGLQSLELEEARLASCERPARLQGIGSCAQRGPQSLERCDARLASCKRRARPQGICPRVCA